MPKQRFYYLVIIMFILSSVAYGEEIIFYELDFPPFLIYEGEFKDKGVLNYVKDSFVEEFSQYDIKTYMSDDKNVFSEMNKKSNILLSAGIKTANRQAIGLYSIPYLLLLPNGIVINKSDYNKIEPYINGAGEINLEYLITESNLKGGISLEHTYGGIIDEIIEEHKNNKFLFPYYFENSEIKLQKIINKELDYVLGNPIETNFYIKNTPNNYGDLLTIPVEGMPDYLFVYVIVSKGEFGEKLLEEVNIFLEKIISQETFHNKYEFWLDDENKKRYRRYIKEAFDFSY